MTPQSKRFAVLLGEAAAIVTVEHVLSIRAGRRGEAATGGPRHLWLQAIASESLSFMLDELIRQRRRAEVTLERAAAGQQLPPGSATSRPRLPRQNWVPVPAMPVARIPGVRRPLPGPGD